MTETTSLFLKLLAYVAAGRLIVKLMRGGAREFAFAALNTGMLYVVFFRNHDSRSLPTFAAYSGLIVFQFATLRLLGAKSGSAPWIAFFVPIAALVFVRYVPPAAYGGAHLPYGPLFIGISYLAFRCSHLVIEVRNGTVKMPGFFQYLAFAFFVPVMNVGPINPYSNYRRGFISNGEPAADMPLDLPVCRAMLRILVGLVKYKFLGNVFFQLGYANFLLDDHYHPWIDLPIAAAFYYLFLYCNFSGFCDMAIGCAGLIGIPVIENFDNPFAARNMREFWNRWHISLSQYMRDVCFSPVSKFLARVLGPENVNHAIALTVMIVFLLVGIWHGTGWNFVIFGLLQGIGVITTHYYAIALKKRLGRDGMKAYNANPWIRAAGMAVTFCYFSMTLFFFANTPAAMLKIFSVMR